MTDRQQTTKSIIIVTLLHSTESAEGASERRGVALLRPLRAQRLLIPGVESSDVVGKRDDESMVKGWWHVSRDLKDMHSIAHFSILHARSARRQMASAMLVLFEEAQAQA